DADQPLEEILFENGCKTIQQERIFANVGMNAKRDVGPRIAETVERGQRYEDIVTNAIDVDDDPIGLFLRNSPAKVRYHGAFKVVPRRPTRRRRPPRLPSQELPANETAGSPHHKSRPPVHPPRRGATGASSSPK